MHMKLFLISIMLFSVNCFAWTEGEVLGQLALNNISEENIRANVLLQSNIDNSLLSISQDEDNYYIYARVMTLQKEKASYKAYVKTIVSELPKEVIYQCYLTYTDCENQIAYKIKSDILYGIEKEVQEIKKMQTKSYGFNETFLLNLLRNLFRVV